MLLVTSEVYSWKTVTGLLLMNWWLVIVTLRGLCSERIQLGFRAPLYGMKSPNGSGA